MKDFLKLMRLKHYLKNILIFLPLIFSGNLLLGDGVNLLKTILGFCAFSLTSSFIYIINDIKDKEKDKKHEVKKNRPIASGKISTPKALIFGLILLIISCFLNYLSIKSFIHPASLILLIYIIINILYSFGLKNIPLIDIAILVSGFILRVIYGSLLINVSISNWLYLTIMSISFYMGLGKRRNERYKSDARTRKVLEYYNKDFLDKNMYMCLAISIVFYSLWCVDPLIVAKTNGLLVWTVPIVILLCMKYSMDIETDNFGDPVDIITKDKVLLGLGLVYGIILLLIIY